MPSGLGKLLTRFLVWSSGTWLGSPTDTPSNKEEQSSDKRGRGGKEKGDQDSDSRPAAEQLENGQDK